MPNVDTFITYPVISDVTYFYDNRADINPLLNGVDFDSETVRSFTERLENFQSWGDPMIQNSDSIYRLSTNRNIQEIKAWRKYKVCKFEWKLRDSEYAYKLRVWDVSKKKYVKKFYPGRVWRLVKVRDKRALNQSGIQLKTNDLIYSQTRITDNSYGIYTYEYNVPFDSYIQLDPNETDQTPHVRRFYKVIGSAYCGVPTVWFSSNPKGVIWDSNFRTSSLDPSPEAYRMGDRTSFVGKFSSQITEVDENSYRKLLERISDSKLDLATGLAELGQTVKMISLAAKSLAQSLLALKRGNVVGAFKGLLPKDKEEASGMFLAYRYGVSPLIGDISGAAEHLARRILDLPPVKIKGKTHVETVNVSDPIVLYGNSTSSTSYITTTSTVIVKYTARYALSDETVREAAQLGFTNPANVAWELVPFSFVVDWFLPIGNFLKALCSLHGVQLIEVTKSILIREKVNCVTSVTATPPEMGVWRVPGSTYGWSLENVYFSRKVLTPSEVTSLRVPTPQLKNPFSAGHLANAVALAVLMFRK